MLVKTFSTSGVCSYISWAIISCLSMACSSISPATKNFKQDDLPLAESKFHVGRFGKSERVTISTRETTTIESGAVLLGKTVVYDRSLR